MCYVNNRPMKREKIYFHNHFIFTRCNQEWHKRADIDKSRREFNWKVVEPYDGECCFFLFKLRS